MNTKRLSRVKLVLFGGILMCVAGVSQANPFSGALNIHLFPSFPHANAIDFHYLSSAGVYFSFRTGQYYYPTRHGWRHSRLLPRHYTLHPRDRHLVHRYHKHHHRDHHGWRGHKRHVLEHRMESHKRGYRFENRRHGRDDRFSGGERRRHQTENSRRERGRG